MLSTLRKLCGSAALLLISLGAVAAQDLTIVGAGGALQDAERKAFFEPFASKSGVKIVEDSYTSGLAKIRGMVQTGQVTWDVVQISASDLIIGCSEGLLEKLDWEKIGNKDEFLPGTASECGAGALVWSFVAAYDSVKLADGPRSWADFFDTERFPGKRGIYNSAVFTLETALMADGVPQNEVYKVLATPEGVDRAFAKLDTIKSSAVFWTSGAESVERLVAGDVVMTSSFNGRVSTANKAGAKLGIFWDGQIYGMDSWTIVKGTPRLGIAEDFVKFASQADTLAKFPEYISYGIVNQKAIGMLAPATLEQLPTAPENMTTAIPYGDEFWTDHEEELEARFKAWQAG